MPAIPTVAELSAYVASLFNMWLAVVGGVFVVVEVVQFFTNHDWREWLRSHRWRFAMVVLMAAQFGAYQNTTKARDADTRTFKGEIERLSGEVARLDGLLHPPIHVYMRWPESWLWNGSRYPDNARIKLDDSARLEMQTRTFQRMDPMAIAPPTQRLTNIIVFLTFSRAVKPIVCDPSRSPLAVWIPDEHNTYYSVIHDINPGLGGNVEEAFCFSVDDPGSLGVKYTFGPAETAPLRGGFDIVVKELRP